MSATEGVLLRVRSERLDQDARFGEQNHPDGTAAAFASAADWHRRDADEAAAAGTLTWRHILTEEVFEALAETDADRLRAELVQVAAVAVGWVESIDRRQARLQAAYDHTRPVPPTFDERA